MGFLFKIYKIISKINRDISNTISYCRTKFKFICCGVNFSTFKTRGVPFVDIEYNRRGEIIFGKNITFNNGLKYNQIGYNTPCIFRCAGANIHVGDNVGFSQSSIVAIGANIYIGDNTLIGGGTKIYSTDFHSVNYIDRQSEYDNDLHTKSEPVVIGNDCFIGAGCLILKGVEIGQKSIIGAGSVVVKNIPPYSLACGNPCRVVRSLK